MLRIKQYKGYYYVIESGNSHIPARFWNRMYLTLDEYQELDDDMKKKCKRLEHRHLHELEHLIKQSTNQ